MKCFIKGCWSFNGMKKPGIAFFRFPHNKRLRQNWIDAAASGIPRDHDIVCSLHFPEGDINVGSSRSRLKRNAIPCIFAKWKSHTENGQSSVKQEEAENETKSSQEEADSVTKHSIEYSDGSTDDSKLDFSEDASTGGMGIQSTVDDSTSQRLKSTMVTKIMKTIEKNANAKTQNTVILGQQEILEQYLKVISASDESRAFGEYVATEIQKYPADLRLTTKRQIIQILIDSMTQLENINKTTAPIEMYPSPGTNQIDNYQPVAINSIHPSKNVISQPNNRTSMPTPYTCVFINSEPEEIIPDYTTQSTNKPFVKLENAAHSTAESSTNESDVNSSAHINLSNPRTIVKDEIHIDTEYESSDGSLL